MLIKRQTKKNFEELAKKIFIGRDIQIFDKALFKLSNKKYSGWVFGNRLRTISYGKRKCISKLPIMFIGCFPRSGSTLLTRMLMQHPEIIGPQPVGKFRYELNIFQDIKTKEFLEEGLGLNKKEIQKFQKYKKDTVLYADKILKYFLNENKKKYVVLKQPKHIYQIKKIFKHFPNSKFIHIIRDGRAATMSQRYFLLPKDKEEWPYEWCCRQWAVAINKGKEFRDDSGYIEIKYKNLIENPEKTMKKLFKFLNIKSVSKKKILSFHKKKSRHKDVSQPINKSANKKWIEKTSKIDKEKFKRIAGAEQKELGYGF